MADAIVDFNVLANPYVGSTYQVYGAIPSPSYVWCDGQQMDVTGLDQYDLAKERMGYTTDENGNEFLNIPNLNQLQAPTVDAGDDNAQNWWKDVAITNPNGSQSQIAYTDAVVRLDGTIQITGFDASLASCFRFMGFITEGLDFLNDKPMNAVGGEEVAFDAQLLVDNNITEEKTLTGVAITAQAFQPPVPTETEKRWIIAVKGV